MESDCYTMVLQYDPKWLPFTLPFKCLGLLRLIDWLIDWFFFYYYYSAIVHLTWKVTVKIFKMLQKSYISNKFITNPEMFLKGLVYPKMKISLCFTPLRSILDVCDFLLSDETNLSFIKNCPGPNFHRDCFRLWQ